MPARSAAVDTVRVIGLVAIVAGHVWTTAFVSHLVYPWHVAVFFVLTGYLWRPSRSLGSDVRKRFRSLLVPYVAWVTVTLAIYIVENGRAGLVDQLKDILRGGSDLVTPFTTFWFITALFVAAVSYRAATPTTDPARVGVAVLAVALATVAGRHLAEVPQGIGLGVAALVFVAAGDLLRVHRARLTGAMACVALGACVVGLAVGVESIDMKLGDFGTPVLSLVVAATISCALVVLVESAELRLPTVPWSIATTVSGVAVVIVLLQGSIFFLTKGELPVARALLGFLVPLAVGLLIARTPAATVLLGRPPEH